MSRPREKHEARRARYQGWLQTAVFIAVLAILGVVLYSSVVVQSSRRAVEMARTAAPQTATAQVVHARRSTPVMHPVAPIAPGNAAQVRELARWGKGYILPVAWSPDGRLLAVGASLGVYLYDSETRAEVRFLSSCNHVVRLAFSPDGQTLAAALSGSAVQRWSVAIGTPLRTEEFTGTIQAMTFAPDGALLVAGCEEAGYGVWLWREGRRTVLDVPGEAGQRGEYEGVPAAISADGRILAAAGPAGTVRIWRLADGTLLRTVQGHRHAANREPRVLDLALSSDAAALAYSLDGWVQLYWLADGTERDLHQSGYHLAFSPDGMTLAAGDYSSVYLWSVTGSSATPLRTLQVQPGSVRALSFSPDGRLLAGTMPLVGRVWLWDAASGQPLAPVEVGIGWVDNIAFSVDGQALLAGVLDGSVWRWDLATGVPDQVLSVFDASPGSLDTRAYLGVFDCLAFSRGGGMIAFGTAGGPQLWQVESPRHVATLLAQGDANGYGPVILDLAFSDDEQMLAAGADDGTVWLWRLADRTLLFKLAGGEGSVWNVGFSPDGRLLAAVGQDGIVRLWRTADGENVHTIGEAGQTVLAFSPDGTTLAVGDQAGAVRLWQVSDWTLLRTLPGDDAGVMSLAWSPDSAVLAAGAAGSRGLLRLWQVSDGALLRELDQVWPREILFSADGTLLSALDGDDTVRTWGIGNR